MAYLGNCKVGDKLIVDYRLPGHQDMRKEVTKIGRKWVTTGDGSQFDIETGMMNEGRGYTSAWFAFPDEASREMWRARQKLESRVLKASMRLYRLDTMPHMDLQTLDRIFTSFLKE